MMTRITVTAGVAAALVSSIAPASATEPVRVIFSEIPGDPTAVVPGARDLEGQPIFAEFKAMEVLSVSADGQQWLLKGRNTLIADLDTMMLIGSGVTGTVLGQEAQPVDGGAEEEVYDFFGSSPPYFNDVGQYVFTARARGGDPATKHKGLFFDGVGLTIVRAESDPALGLIDSPPGDSGDELFGNSFGSMHVLDDGTFGYQDSTIKNIHSSRRPAVFYDDTAFLQSGITEVEELIWDSLDANDFWTTPDGSRWIAQGDDDGPTNTDDILVVDNQVVLREGSAIGSTSVVVDAVFATKLIPSGDWYARGDDPVDDDWAVRSGVLLAATGDPVTDGATEHWGDAFLAFTGNRGGDWILAGSTDAADPETDSVIVLNGSEVVVREGDPVDVDGDGVADDGVFIGRGDPTLGAFRPDDLALTDDGVLYFLASLRDAEGNDLGADGLSGDALLRIDLVDCPEDLDDSGAVDFGDILSILAAWGPCPPSCPEDLDGSDAVDFGDILAVLAAWGPC